MTCYFVTNVTGTSLVDLLVLSVVCTNHTVAAVLLLLHHCAGLTLLAAVDHASNTNTVTNLQNTPERPWQHTEFQGPTFNNLKKKPCRLRCLNRCSTSIQKDQCAPTLSFMQVRNDRIEVDNAWTGILTCFFELTLKAVTLGPTSVTIPAISWPGTIG